MRFPHRCGSISGPPHHTSMAPDTPPGSALATASASAPMRITNIDELQRYARLFAASGYFGQNPRDPKALMAECAIKILAGAEAGFPPFASATGVTVIKGRPGFGANLLAQAIKRHPVYDYRVLEKTDKICRIRFLAGREELGVETFTIEMAERAGLLIERESSKGVSPWRAFPEAMLFARCLTAGMRTHCPDALGGLAAYTPEELGAQGQIDQNGVEVVDVTEVPAPTTAPAPAPAQPSATDSLDAAVAAAYRSGLTPEGLTVLVHELSKGEAQFPYQLPVKTLARLAKSGVSQETAERCNALARQQAEPVVAAAEPEPAVPDHQEDDADLADESDCGPDSTDDPDDLPAAWDLDD